MKKPPRRIVLPTLLGVMVGSLLTIAACEDPLPTPPNVRPGGLPNAGPHLGPFDGLIDITPTRMAITPKGHLFVTDPRAGVVVAFDPTTLQPSGMLHVGGKPVAIGLAGSRILVGDARRQTVEVYNPKGRFQYSFGGPGAVQYPTDLAVDMEAELVFVVDAGAKNVKVFSLHGVLQYTISGPGADVSQLQRPTGIIIDEGQQEVLISDAGQHGDHAAIKIFGYDGTFLDEISGEGSCGMLGCSGGFSTPKGLALDGQGRIYLADVLQAQILVYDRDSGQLVETLGGRNAGPPMLRVPFDVVIGKNPDVFVTSQRTGTVEVFRNGAGAP